MSPALPSEPPAWISASGDDVLLRIKAVPGASREGVAGPLGDRLKIRVAAPPEGGKANRAIGALVARLLGVRPAAVTIEAGHGHAEKILRIAGRSRAAVVSALSRPGDRNPGRSSAAP